MEGSQPHPSEPPTPPQQAASQPATPKSCIGKKETSCFRILNKRAAPKAKTFMQNLVYPAFLGTFLVSFFQELSTACLPSVEWNDFRTWWPLTWDITQFMSVWMLFYFTTLFVETETTDAGNYNLFAAAIDVVEVGVMFFAFRSLGHLGGKVDPFAFYTAMALAVALPILTRVLSGKGIAHMLNGLCALGIAVLIWGSTLPRDASDSVFGPVDCYVLMSIAFLTAIYVIALAYRMWISNLKGGEMTCHSGIYHLVGISLERQLGEKDKVPNSVKVKLTIPGQNNGTLYDLELVDNGSLQWQLAGKYQQKSTTSMKDTVRAVLTLLRRTGAAAKNPAGADSNESR